MAMVPYDRRVKVEQRVKELPRKEREENLLIAFEHEFAGVHGTWNRALEDWEIDKRTEDSPNFVWVNEEAAEAGFTRGTVLTIVRRFVHNEMYTSPIAILAEFPRRIAIRIIARLGILPGPPAWSEKFSLPFATQQIIQTRIQGDLEFVTFHFVQRHMAENLRLSGIKEYQRYENSAENRIRFFENEECSIILRRIHGRDFDVPTFREEAKNSGTGRNCVVHREEVRTQELRKLLDGAIYLIQSLEDPFNQTFQNVYDSVQKWEDFWKLDDTESLAEFTHIYNVLYKRYVEYSDEFDTELSEWWGKIAEKRVSDRDREERVFKPHIEKLLTGLEDIYNVPDINKRTPLSLAGLAPNATNASTYSGIPPPPALQLPLPPPPSPPTLHPLPPPPTPEVVAPQSVPASGTLPNLATAAPVPVPDTLPASPQTFQMSEKNNQVAAIQAREAAVEAREAAVEVRENAVALEYKKKEAALAAEKKVAKARALDEKLKQLQARRDDPKAEAKTNAGNKSATPPTHPFAPPTLQTTGDAGGAVIGNAIKSPEKGKKRLTGEAERDDHQKRPRLLSSPRSSTEADEPTDSDGTEPEGDGGGESDATSLGGLTGKEPSWNEPTTDKG